MEDKDKKPLNDKLDDFLKKEESEKECEGDECFIVTDKSIIERVNKKIIIEDGRQLLI